MPQDGVMPTTNREEILKGAEEAFFLALLDGYAGGENRKSTKVKTNNGHTTTVTFVHGDFVVKDEWHTHPGSQKSGGSTLITHKDFPVWLMSYQGEYQGEAIPFLKAALRSSYEKKEFNGGRGPMKVPFGNIIDYSNNWGGNFEKFEGREEVLSYITKLLGFHEFFGMALI